MKVIPLYCLLGFLAALCGGCAGHNQPAGSDTAFSGKPAAGPTGVTLTNHLSVDLLRPANEPFTLGPGDSIEIEIIGQPATRALAIVGPDGKIYYYLLPGMDVWGLTLDQTRDHLERALVQYQYVNSPRVSVSLQTIGSKFIWLLGRVNRPGIYPLTAPTTLLEAFSRAGGAAKSTSQVSAADLADLRHSFVMRQGQLLPVDFYQLLREGDTSQNIYLRPDDFIFVPSTLEQEVYVLGAVVNPRAITYTEQMTLVSALAGGNGSIRYDFMAGNDVGPMTKDAYLTHVAILRGSLAKPEILVVNASAIIRGHAADVALQPGDIIYVPNTPYTTLKRYVDLVVGTFVSTIAVNEGIRAGGGQVGVGVSVPVAP
jgi:polysaccharide export outer membrane protein